MNTNRRMVGIMLAITLASLASCATSIVSTAHAQQQQTRSLRVDVNQSIFGGNLYVAGVCDTGNGTMVYVAYTSGLATQPLISTTAVANGCRKDSRDER